MREQGEGSRLRERVRGRVRGSEGGRHKDEEYRRSLFVIDHDSSLPSSSSSSWPHRSPTPPSGSRGSQWQWSYELMTPPFPADSDQSRTGLVSVSTNEGRADLTPPTRPRPPVTFYGTHSLTAVFFSLNGTMTLTMVMSVIV